MLIKNKKRMTGLVLIVFLGIFVFISFVIACNDFLCYKIPNQLLILIVILYVVRSVLFIDLISILQPSIYAAITLGIGFLLYLLKLMGAGDAKLLAATTLWMADYNILHFYGYIAIIGGILAIVYFSMGQTIYDWRHKILDRVKAWPNNHFAYKIMVLPNAQNPSQAAYQHPINELKALPYGVPIFFSALVLISQNSFR